MIVIRYENLLDQNFITALSKLGNWSGYKNMKSGKIIGKIVRDVNKQLPSKLAHLQTLVDELGERNKDNAGFSIKDENIERWDKEVTMPCIMLEHRQLVTSEVEGAGLTTSELVAIEAFVDDTKLKLLK